MTTPPQTDPYGRHVHPDATKKVDLASASLLAIGLLFGALVIFLVFAHGVSPLFIIPSAIATYVGIKHFFKYEAPRDLSSVGE
jgi:hypothetical protein